ncbi:MAG TPA: nucleoside hydrolase [Fimbriiglobus sp.]|jgi:inosine-uridine nucleoside N-ribohydrolase
MAKKVILIADPGIDTSFAVALALHDPELDVLALVPTAGNVSAEQATINCHVLIDLLDPPKWPKLASALPVQYESNGAALHGPQGLGDLSFEICPRNPPPPADKVLIDLVREHPREVTVIVLGPSTTLAAAFARDPDLARLVERVVLVGGAYREPGNVGPVAEFHVWLDPEAAKQILHADCHPTLISLDVTRKLILSPTELLELPNPNSRTCKFLRQVVPFALRASASLYGIEGFHLKDVLGIAAVALPGSVSTQPKCVDVETKGEATRGMTVVDDRRTPSGPPNVHLATGAAIGEIRQYVERILTGAP